MRTDSEQLEYIQKRLGEEKAKKAKISKNISVITSFSLIVMIFVSGFVFLPALIGKNKTLPPAPVGRSVGTEAPGYINNNTEINPDFAAVVSNATANRENMPGYMLPATQAPTNYDDNNPVPVTKKAFASYKEPCETAAPVAVNTSVEETPSDSTTPTIDNTSFEREKLVQRKELLEKYFKYSPDNYTFGIKFDSSMQKKGAITYIQGDSNEDRGYKQSFYYKENEVTVCVYDSRSGFDESAGKDAIGNYIKNRFPSFNTDFTPLGKNSETVVYDNNTGYVWGTINSEKCFVIKSSLSLSDVKTVVNMTDFFMIKR